MTCYVKKLDKVRIQGFSEFTFNTMLYGKLWEHLTKTALNIYILGVQWRRNFELVMEVISANRWFSLIPTPIIDDDAVRICPSDMIGWDNRGIKGVRLGKISSENQYQTIEYLTSWAAWLPQVCRIFLYHWQERIKVVPSGRKFIAGLFYGLGRIKKHHHWWKFYRGKWIRMLP